MLEDYARNKSEFKAKLKKMVEEFQKTVPGILAVGTGGVITCPEIPEELTEAKAIPKLVIKSGESRRTEEEKIKKLSFIERSLKSGQELSYNEGEKSPFIEEDNQNCFDANMGSPFLNFVQGNFNNM